MASRTLVKDTERVALVLHSQDGRCHKIVLGERPHCLVFLVAGLVLVLRFESFFDGLVVHVLASLQQLSPHFGIQTATVRVCPEVRGPICQGKDALSGPPGQSKKLAVVDFLLLRGTWGLQPFGFTTLFWEK